LPLFAGNFAQTGFYFVPILAEALGSVKEATAIGSCGLCCRYAVITARKE
jgi:hypothetical protein